MSDHHLLLQIQTLIAALQVIMNNARDLERCVQESQAVDEAVAVADAVTEPIPGKSVRRRQPLRFAVAAGAVAKTCFACQREVLQQPVDGRLLDADGTDHSQTCTLRHLMSGGQNRARAQPPRKSKSSTARKRSKRSVG